MLTIDFINVGYGDAILIRDKKNSFNILVDCGDKNIGDAGRDSKRISAADFLMREKIAAIDLLVLTHLHLDHSGGLSDVLNTVQVKEFWTNYIPDDTLWGKPVQCPDSVSPAAKCLLTSLNIFSDALSRMRKAGTIIKHINENFSLDLTSDLSADVLLESGALQKTQEEICDSVFDGIIDEKSIDNWDRFINDTSVRLRLEYAKRRIELPGDIYAACWEKNEIKPCDIVKLPHHGHCDSMTEGLAYSLNPEYAVVSVSNTREDDCPCAKVIDLLRNQNAQIFFTDYVHMHDIETENHYSVHLEILDSGQIDVLKTE